MMRELPSKFVPPLVGDTPAFLKDPAGLLEERRKELGPVFKIKVLGEDVACFVGPDAFAHFLDERYFTRASASPPHVQEIMDKDAVSFLDGDAFKTRKDILMQVFSRDALESYAPVLERVMKRHLARMIEKPQPFACVPDLTAMGMTIAAALFLGADPDVDDASLVAGFDAAFAGFLTVPVKLPFTQYGKAIKARDELRVKIDGALAAHVRDPSRNDAMTRLLQAKSKSGASLSQLEARTETFHFFGAYVPVIGGLTYLMALLGQHAEVRDKLRAEIKEKCASGAVTPSIARELPYLDAVCRESRRVQPILPITFFARVKEPTSFKDVQIPVGIKAIGCIAATLKDPDTYADPDKFDPERWLAPRATERHHAGWVPHGGGAHLVAHRCAGEQLADAMLKTFAILLLRDFDWSLPAQDLTPMKQKLFATPKDGLVVAMKRI